MTKIKEENGNMYPGFDTWNPLAGECPHKCTYCSTNNWKKRMPVIREKYSGPLRLDEKQLSKNLGNGKTYFVCAQNDLFAKKVPDEFIEKVMDACEQYDNTYLFQTKNPKRFNEIPASWFPVNTILCTTIETNRYYPQMGKTPDVFNRAFEMSKIVGFTKYVTIEPIMDFDLEDMVDLIRLCGADKINIGADSKGNHLPEPSKEKLLALIDELKKFTVIDEKRNLGRILNT
jgi:protein gp37